MYPFIPDVKITDLGFGSGFALWGFRAIASGKENCRHLTTGFNRAFEMDNDELCSQHGGRYGKLAMNALKSFSYQLGCMGRRKIILSDSGTMGVTADELCIVAALSAAQGVDDNLCHLHLTWLLGQSQTHLARHAAKTYGIICETVGIHLTRPIQATEFNPEAGLKKPPQRTVFK